MHEQKPQKIIVSSLTRRSHHKPYLMRHFSLLIVGSWLAFVGLMGLFNRYFPTGQPKGVLSHNTDVNTNSGASVFSVGRVSFSYDKQQLDVATTDPASGNGGTTVHIRPLPGSGSVLEASARLAIFQSSVGEVVAAKTKPQAKTAVTGLAIDKIGGVDMQKTVYRHTTNIGNNEYDSYSIEWSDTAGSDGTLIRLEGLHDPIAIPISFIHVFNTMSVGPGKVLSATSKSVLANKYITDSVSPAVLKIYRVTCGILMVDERPISDNECNVAVGSGFFVSGDGLIATSGHVVEYEAEDALINTLLKNPTALVGFLQYLGLNNQQIKTVAERPQLIAAVISKLYDEPEEKVRYKDKKSALLVALGSNPLSVQSQADAKKLIEFSDTDSIKKAELVDINYTAKDLLVIAAGDSDGFSSSDVALLKIKASNTPFIEMYKDKVTQNQKVTIIGFPGDADNQLTDNNSLSPTVTNGSISAIRIAAGSSYKLYQSDADASQGSSGGPVITEDGHALGLLTYRFKSKTAVDAAKSYIRDINDVKKLALSNKVALGNGSSVQADWHEGLKLFEDNRFSGALAKFKKVKNSYPAHRLAKSYIEASEEAIAAGHDIKDPSMPLVVASSFIGASGASGAVIMIGRHHTAHHFYKQATRARVLRPHHAGT